MTNPVLKNCGNMPRINKNEIIIYVLVCLIHQDERECSISFIQGHGDGEKTFYLSSWRNWLFRTQESQNAEKNKQTYARRQWPVFRSIGNDYILRPLKSVTREIGIVHKIIPHILWFREIGVRGWPPFLTIRKSDWKVNENLGHSYIAYLTLHIHWQSINWGAHLLKPSTYAWSM